MWVGGCEWVVRVSACVRCARADVGKSGVGAWVRACNCVRVWVGVYLGVWGVCVGVCGQGVRVCV